MRIMVTVFLAIGIGLLGGAFFAYRYVDRFTRSAATAQGVVAGNLRAHRHRGDMFYPRIRFRTADGREIAFVSNAGTNPASYHAGDAVTVLYDPRDPDHAVIASLLHVWMVPLILGGLGAIFCSIGGIMLAVKAFGARKAAWLEHNGRRIQAQFTGVVVNRSVRVNGVNPYRISCQWLDPTTNRIRIFQSRNIWFDPTAYLTSKSLDVLIDPDRPSRYLVDTAFLPQAER